MKLVQERIPVIDRLKQIFTVFDHLTAWNLISFLDTMDDTPELRALPLGYL